MIVEVLKEALIKNLGHLKPSPNNWLRRNCPLCHTQGHSKDTRSRFGIQFTADTIAVNCFNCGFTCSYTEGKPISKSLKFLLKQIGTDPKFIEYVEFEAFRIKHRISPREGTNILEKARNSIDLWHTKPLPDDSLPIHKWLEYNNTDSNFLTVIKYLESRSIRNWREFYWCPSSQHQLNKRFIIPYYYNKRTVGFTARLGYNSADKTVPKYYQQSPTDFVYNLNSQSNWERKITLVTEGVLDAWTVEGVGMMGSATAGKIDIVNRLGKQVIVSPDRDDAGYELVKIAMENNWAVAFPKWPKGIKDATDAATVFGRVLTVKSIIDSAVQNPSKIKIKWAIERNERKK